ncbi:uncharacterized protein LOC100501198 [Zea mays]|jgi:hypothetical protein|uniref:Uncharacterized protein n=3 Tax=Zea mays TaxID=4577 RepID=C4J1R0_MAIZE|nr:uncharacterized protein LOC100501198 [Zea mays]ACR35110.1 unknown [Zea mays]|eukprot:NP_001182912.1 uncharacterized protein LOC100501198 [Zea mays]
MNYLLPSTTEAGEQERCAAKPTVARRGELGWARRLEQAATGAAPRHARRESKQGQCAATMEKIRAGLRKLEGEQENPGWGITVCCATMETSKGSRAPQGRSWGLGTWLEEARRAEEAPAPGRKTRMALGAVRAEASQTRGASREQARRATQRKIKLRSTELELRTGARRREGRDAGQEQGGNSGAGSRAQEEQRPSSVSCAQGS